MATPFQCGDERSRALRRFGLGFRLGFGLLLGSGAQDPAADGGKLGRTAHAYVGPSTLVHTLVTDTAAPADEVAALEAAGTVVRTV
jgi:hypothetical protein